MARINRKLIVSGATAIVLVGVTVAMAAILSNRTFGSSATTSTAASGGAQANVELRVAPGSLDGAINDALAAGEAGVNLKIQARTDYPTVIDAVDLVPHLGLSAVCPTKGWSIDGPAFGYGVTGPLESTSFVDVGTVNLAVDLTDTTVDHTGCLNAVAALFTFGPGALTNDGAGTPNSGRVYTVGTGAKLTLTSICVMKNVAGAAITGTPTNYNRMGSPAGGEGVMRLMNTGDAAAPWTATMSGSSGQVAAGTLQPGEHAFFAVPHPGTVVVTSPATSVGPKAQGSEPCRL